jgi:hypothetical protein
VTERSRRRLPDFGSADYQRLLGDLGTAGYALRPVTAMRLDGGNGTGRTAYLRHDVDFHIQLVEPLAEVEQRAGVRATYYVLLSQHYNAWQRDNRSVLRRLVDMGHEVGLHYDLETYPTDPEAARSQLRREVETLEMLVQEPVRTVVMHQPSLGGADIFLSVDEYVHPHDPRAGDGLMYVSDSCRGWRDDTLLRCWTDEAPPRLLLNTHPELWLAPEITDPLEYLDFLVDASSLPYRRFIDTEVRASWRARLEPRSQ